MYVIVFALVLAGFGATMYAIGRIDGRRRERAEAAARREKFRRSFDG